MGQVRLGQSLSYLEGDLALDAEQRSARLLARLMDADSRLGL